LDIHCVLVFCTLCCLIGSATAQEITIALGSEPTTLDPQLREDGGERAVNDNIYETLMARKPDGKLVPGLAASEPRLIDPLHGRSQVGGQITTANFNADVVSPV
jgi:peptide/nickel transport system substrate-binding protein